MAGTSTEFNTLFETVTSISEKVDPVRLNATLSAAAEALTGLGSDFGRSLTNGNQILGDLNPRLPVLRHDVRALADLTQVYTRASPPLWDGLDAAVTSARALRNQQDDLDAALLAAVGFGDTAADVFGRGGPYLVRGSADLIPTTQTLDENSPSDLLHDPEFRRDRPQASRLARRQRLLAGQCQWRRRRRRSQSVYLPRQPAPPERQRWSGRQAGLLAVDHPRPMAGAVPGDGHRGQYCALQPFRGGPTAARRVRLGPPGRCIHDQPVTDLPKAGWKDPPPATVIKC